MSRTLPPKVQAAKDQAHHVFDWAVPGRLDGERLTIAGSLDYQPPSSKAPTKILIVVIGLLVLLGGATVWLRQRRSRDAEA